MEENREIPRTRSELLGGARDGARGPFLPTPGTNDYITKPANVGSVSHALQRIREELIPRIKAFCGKAVGIETPPVALGRTASFSPPNSRGRSRLAPR